MSWRDLASGIADAWAGSRDIVSVLLGAAAGFWLSERSAKNRETRASAEAREGCREIVSSEIDLNLDRLSKMWDIISEKIPLDNRVKQRAEVFIQISSPNWSQEIWTSQYAHVAIAFDRQEIQATSH